MSGDRLALLSVSDKQGVVELAGALVSAGFALLSTGGTATLLRESGLAVTDVSEHTGASEMMAGRVKTLHPTVHGGLLGRRGVDDAVMQERGIAPIDVVVVNLYPFAHTVARADVSFDEAIENIDIGGPAMLRSAAKNHASVAVVTDPSDYARLIESLNASEPEQAALRFDLAAKAFEHTARYDGMIAEWLGARVDNGPMQPPDVFPRTLNRQYERAQSLRYGENPHQRAAFYREHSPAPGTLAAATLVQGKALSYNNVMDADTALGCVQLFTGQPACVIVKHANPCGVSQADSQRKAYENAYRTDPTSAFGGIIAFNHRLEHDTADSLVSRQFVEVIIAPGFAPGVTERLAQHPNVRVLDVSVSGFTGLAPYGSSTAGFTMRPVSGGLLVQDDDLHQLAESDMTVVTDRKPDQRELVDLLFAWRVAQYVKSNAIVYARDLATVGVGAGQMSRVYSARIAAIKAGDEGMEVQKAVMASDAFFPFRDGIDSAADVGIAAVIQPGGSKNDDQVIAAANQHGMAMVFTGVRHFRH